MITTHKYLTICAAAGIAFNLILFVDLYLLPKSKIAEILSNGNIDYVKGGHKIQGYDVYYITTESNHKYNVPEVIYNRILIGNEFTVRKTFLFKKAASIVWCEDDNNCYTQNIHPINAYLLNQLIHSFFSGFCIFLLLQSALGKSTKWKTSTYIISILSLCFLIYYLFK